MQLLMVKLLPNNFHRTLQLTLAQLLIIMILGYNNNDMYCLYYLNLRLLCFGAEFFIYFYYYFSSIETPQTF